MNLLRSARGLAIPVIALLFGACGGHHHHSRTAEDWQRILENPGRDEWQRPQEVVKALGFARGETVADIGAGSGYFTRRIAPQVQTIYAVDVDPKLVDMAVKSSGPNTRGIVAANDDPRLPSGSIDTVFICDVLHHIANRPAYYAKLRAGLKSGGRIVIVDFHKREEKTGPPLAMRLSDVEVIGEFERAGMKLARRWDFLPRQYMLEFR